MATLYPSVYDIVYVRTTGENYSVGIGWTSVADLTDVDDVITDIIIGNIRAAISFSTVIVTDIVTASIVTTAKVQPTATWTPRIPVRMGVSTGVYIANTGQYTRIPVREVLSSGVIVAEGNLPVREFASEVLQDWPSTVEGRISVRTLESYKGAEQVVGKLPTRNIESSSYENTARVDGYIPVREGESELIITEYATLNGKIPVRSILTDGYATYLITLTKSRPCWTGSAAVTQDYQVDASGKIPPRILSSFPYDNGVSVIGYIPPRVIGSGSGIGGGTGEGSTVIPTIPTSDGDYILVYSRP